jgi:hypothetical protein
VLANHAGKDGVTFVGRARLAEECCCQPQAISKNFARLEDGKLAARVERRRENGSRTSDWTILAPSSSDRGPMVDATQGEVPEGVAARALRSGTENVSVQVRIKGGPEQSVEQSVTESVNTPLPLKDGTDNGVEIVWAQYQATFPSGAPQRRLDATRRRVIEQALKVRSAQECCHAVDGLARSEHHVKGGYTDIRYALRGKPREGESVEDRIDMMAAKACAAGEKGKRFVKKSSPYENEF